MGPVGKFEKADKSEEFSNVAQEMANQQEFYFLKALSALNLPDLAY